MAKDTRVSQVIQVLQTKPWLRTSELASSVDLSSRHLRRLFTAETTLTIADHALELRLQSARHLLLTTFLSVKEIRNEVGMSDAANFSRPIQAPVRHEPLAYRRAFYGRFDQQIVVAIDTYPPI
jgi:transcriptional regulator GlxA family with amidase domain